MKLFHVKFGRSFLVGVERAMNALIDELNSNRIASAPGYRTKRTRNGTTLDIEVPAPEPVEAGASVQQFKITAIADDSLTAQEWDGTTLGDTVTIAKPWRLRKTGWDGATVAYNFNGVITSLRYAYNATRPGYRTATNTSTLAVENQAIIPVYSVGDILYGTEPTGGTLVSGVTWLDLNVDARAWARY